MLFEKPLKITFFQAANIIVSIFLIVAFIIAGQNITETFKVASISALNSLEPKPMDYFWELNIHQAALDKNKIRIYADYYEHLLQIFPSLWEDYGILGYCYHYLNDDPKAIRFLQVAIQYNPDFFLNYYNLAIIYINESRYQEAAALLQKALKVSPMTSLKNTFTSRLVYSPLLLADPQKAFTEAAAHLRMMYNASSVMIKLLHHADNSQITQALFKKLRPELYAF
jgi:tetratricopeptide (TPR) repeat protein